MRSWRNANVKIRNKLVLEVIYLTHVCRHQRSIENPPIIDFQVVDIL